MAATCRAHLAAFFAHPTRATSSRRERVATPAPASRARGPRRVVVVDASSSSSSSSSSSDPPPSDRASAPKRAARARLVDPNDASNTPLSASRGPSLASAACVSCDGTGASPCDACDGRGALPAGGFHAKNHVDMRSIVGTNWTAHRRTRGWRHFEAIGKSPADKKCGKAHATVELAATCDRAITIHVSTRELKDRTLWSAGWKQREELDWSGDPNSPEGAIASPKLTTPCVKCDGVGKVPCEAKDCALGATRLARRREVVEDAERRMKRALRGSRERANEGDAAAADVRRRMKKTLKDMSRAESESEARRNKRRNKKASKGKNAAANGEEDWGAAGRRRRDERLEKWLRGAGGLGRGDPEENQ